MSNPDYIYEAGSLMTELHVAYDMLTFKYKDKATIPSCEELVMTCGKLLDIFQQLKTSSDSSQAFIALCAFVSGYANNVFNSLFYHYNIYLPYTIYFKNIEERIRFYAGHNAESQVNI